MEDERTEFLRERYGLSTARIREIGTEKTVPAPFSDYFRHMARFLLQMEELKARVDAGRTRMTGGNMDSLEVCQEWNESLYRDILPEHYEKSYGNPEYAVRMLGEEYGRILSFLYTELRGMIVYAYEQRLEEQVILLELFIEVYNRFEDEELPSYRELQQIVYWFESDYSEIFVTRRVREAVDPELDFAVRIIMDSDLGDLRYLYQYGEYVS
ncbi:MAG: leucyl aminopeptidase, partial [Lachnospiraceae bacterium]|nr:leucyl aminopeptidase [Lachnospiraceae bacterium]